MAIVPVTAVIVALGVYPQVMLDRTEEATTAKVAPAPSRRRRGGGGGAEEEAPEGGQPPPGAEQQISPRSEQSRRRRRDRSPPLGAVKAPVIDYQGLSPLFATVGGAVATMLAGLISGRFAQRVLVPLLAAASLLTAIGLTAANWEAGDSAPIIEGALAIDTLALFMSMLFYVAGLATVLLSLRADVTREAGAGEYMTLLLGSISGMVIVAGAENLVTLFVGFELLSIPLYILCAGEVRSSALAGGGAEVPGGRLGGIRDAALRAGADLRRHRLDRLQRDGRRHRRPPSSSATRCC